MASSLLPDSLEPLFFSNLTENKGGNILIAVPLSVLIKSSGKISEKHAKTAYLPQIVCSCFD
jgi:hypothetical protein